jgi:hypothetical protein
MTLIERLRAATEGSRDLDYAVAEHIRRKTVPLDWTTSIDDAAALVPATTFWGIGYYPGEACAWVGCEANVDAATPALALCIAALMAQGIK